ncbi:MAG: 16S rRNA (cytosine(1402)-N(4))-methyltransferase, partial [Acidobacteriota bacterium]
PPALDQAVRVLKPAGRLAVIAFHSLEDRLVKQTFRHLSGRCVCPPGEMLCHCHPETLIEVVTRRPLRPEPRELATNSRARSARLRVAARREE